MKLFTQVYRYADMPTTLDVNVPDGWRVGARALAIEAGCVILTLLLEPEAPEQQQDETPPAQSEAAPPPRDAMDDEPDAHSVETPAPVGVIEIDEELAALMRQAEEQLKRPIPELEAVRQRARMQLEAANATTEEPMGDDEDEMLLGMNFSYAHAVPYRRSLPPSTYASRSAYHARQMERIEEFLSEAEAWLFDEWRAMPPITLEEAVAVHGNALDSSDVWAIQFYRRAYERWCEREGIEPQLRTRMVSPADEEVIDV